MKKKLTIIVTGLMLMVLAVPTVYAATKPDVQKDIQALYQQIFDLQKKIVDKRVEGGQITTEQGKQIKERLDNMKKYSEENGYNNGGMTGGGMMNGTGGYGGMMGNGGNAGMMSGVNGYGGMMNGNGSNNQ